MTDVIGYSPDQALARELDFIAVNGSMNHWAHPEGLLAAGGPIRTARSRCGTHHVPMQSGFSGYFLSVAFDADPVR